MMFNVKKILLLVSLFFLLYLQINSRVIKGVVRDIGFRSVENVAIHIKETGKYTISLSDGYFELNVPDGLSTISLVFESEYHYDKTVKLKLKGKLKPVTIILVQKEYLQNEILVTAFDTEERSLNIPKAQNIISELEVKEKISESLVDTLTNYTPGVHFIGSGGFMATPSIRGLARRRVLLMMDGVRITGDRRAGNSGAFLAPEL
ncbi:MAG: TonB-dependent receptor plug domain-containing protein, partial [Candidatus Aminicenantes bacterium]|nr:TonB-dependent receptor plug domain-containing protein [Candidatus Aminicenantes bacterium]